MPPDGGRSVSGDLEVIVANEFTERMRSIGVLRGGRSRSATVTEGRAHPETGLPYKATTDERGNTTTEHATKDDRVDVMVRPEMVRHTREQR